MNPEPAEVAEVAELVEGLRNTAANPAGTSRYACNAPGAVRISPGGGGGVLQLKQRLVYFVRRN
ncbi:MAG: hypothetical protein ACLFS4_08100, partial [Opitutales bacterium]